MRNLTRNFVSLFETLFLCYHYFESAYIPWLTYIMYLFFCTVMEILRKPGHRKLKKTLSVFNQNLNSLAAHNSSKFTQLKVIMYSSIYKHNFTCLFDTYLYCGTPDSLLELEGYDLVCADHLNNIKRSRVSIYYKESLLTLI